MRVGDPLGQGGLEDGLAGLDRDRLLPLSDAHLERHLVAPLCWFPI
jgi:hypothetical protein